MKVELDRKADAIYFTLDEKTPILGSREVAPGIVVDYDDKQGVVGVEILNVSKRVTAESLEQLQFVKVAS